MDLTVLNPLSEVGRPLLHHLGWLFILGLVMSAGGFYRVVYFVSLGYAFSIAAMAAATAFAFRSNITLLSAAQILLLLLYGLRLGSYLLNRERSASYQQEKAEIEARSHKVTLGIRFLIWLSVALLYVAMYSPSVFIVAFLEAIPGASVPSLWVGVPLMAGGLVLEAWADWQKSRYKAKAPRRFCDLGLYRFVRCPNYLGEIVFWLGQFVAGISGYHHFTHWILALVGAVCIVLIMLGAARSLELKQDARYGGDEEYQAYVKRVPILLPWLPIYSLRNLKVYLG